METDFLSRRLNKKMQIESTETKESTQARTPNKKNATFPKNKTSPRPNPKRTNAPALLENV